MKILRSIFDFYINSSIHVGLAVMALAALSVMQLGFVPEPSLLLFIWLGTICAYNFVKYAGISNRHNLNNSGNISVIRIFTVLCFFGFLYYGWLQPARVWYIAGVFGALTALYAIPVFQGKNLRSLKGSKVFVIAAVWMGMAVLLPLKYHNIGFGERALLQSLEIFLLVVVLMMPFEIRDLKYDEAGLSTIPQMLGVVKTKWLGTIILIVIAFVMFQQLYVYATYLPVNLGVLGVMLAFLWFSKKEQGPYYASFWVESIPIAWFIAYIYI